MKKRTRGELSKIARRITFYPRERNNIFSELNHIEKSRVLMLLSKKIQKDILSLTENEEIVPILEHLDPVDATDIVRLLSEPRGKKIIDALSAGLRQNVELLVKFDPQSAAGIMNTDYIQVEEDSLIRDVAEKFREYEKQTGKLPVIIVQRDGKVVGQMPVHQFGFAKQNEKIGKYLSRIPKIPFTSSKNHVVNVFRKNRHNRVVVVGEEESVLGIIYSDDIIRLLREEESASLYNFAGVADEEEVGDPINLKVKFRYKWLIINLGTSFLAAMIVGLFEGTISKYVLLAVYMPIVAGMGGNAATQTLAVLVRGISLKQIRLRTAWPVLKREVGAGLINGLINGFLVACVVLFFNRDIMIALILSMAMVINLFVAAFFGTLIPLVMRRLGKDPAASATIFITTATDVLGFLTFLGLAAILLS